MTAVLLQVPKLTPVQRAVRDQFQEGGSMGVALLMILGIIALVLFTYCVTRRLQGEDGGHPRPDDPQKLYRDLLGVLDLTPAQRHALDTAAADLKLRHPTRILLSPVLFDRYMVRWSAAGDRADSQAGEASSEQLVSQIRTALFPAVCTM